MTEYPTHYGRWAGNPAGNPARPDWCVAVVYNKWHPNGHQCNKKRGHGPDGAYCKQHDPIARDLAEKQRLAKFHKQMDEIRAKRRAEEAVAKAIKLIAEGHNNPRALAQWALDGGNGEMP